MTDFSRSVDLGDRAQIQGKIMCRSAGMSRCDHLGRIDGIILCGLREKGGRKEKGLVCWRSRTSRLGPDCYVRFAAERGVLGVVV